MSSFLLKQSFIVLYIVILDGFLRWWSRKKVTFPSFSCPMFFLEIELYIQQQNSAQTTYCSIWVVTILNHIYTPLRWNFFVMRWTAPCLQFQRYITFLKKNCVQESKSRKITCLHNNDKLPKQDNPSFECFVFLQVCCVLSVILQWSS